MAKASLARADIAFTLRKECSLNSDGNFEEDRSI
jgi:hypothetical protein